MPMDHKFALCRKLDEHCVRRSILLPTDKIDESLEWLPINQQAEPVHDKETETLDVTKKKVNGKYQITYTKRKMTAKELFERVI